MTASFVRLPYDVFEKILTRITNEMSQVTRVIYDATYKPPVTYPCYAGIDFPTQRELLAYRVCRGIKSLDEINKRVASI